MPIGAVTFRFDPSALSALAVPCIALGDTGDGIVP
jgi:hypothetical protein